LVNTPSIIFAGNDRELEESAEFRRKLKENVAVQNARTQKKFKDTKQKYDRPDVDYIQDESNIGLASDESK